MLILDTIDILSLVYSNFCCKKKKKKKKNNNNNKNNNKKKNQFKVRVRYFTNFLILF